jgi:hypothetical protein
MNKSKLHLIYSHDYSGRAPGEIGRILGEELNSEFEVIIHDWASSHKITPMEGDVLIGHPHTARGTTLRKSWNGNWRAKILLFPFNPDPLQNSFVWKLMSDADAFIAISGLIWLENLKNSRFSSWESKFRRVDLGIHSADYPMLKMGSIPENNFGLLYLGRTEYPKSRRDLNIVGRVLKTKNLFWVGSGRGPKGFRALGFLPSNSKEMKLVVENSDFLILLSKYDAQPATILEAMCWGLVPIMTKTSGFKFDQVEGIFLEQKEIPQIASLVSKFLQENNDSIQELRVRNRERIIEYNWNVFVEEVKKVIHEVLDPSFQKQIIRYKFREKMLFRCATLVSPIRFRRVFWKTQIKCLFSYTERIFRKLFKRTN